MLRDHVIEEIRDERANYLKWVLGFMTFFSVLLFIAGPFNHPNLVSAANLPWAILAVTIISSYLLMAFRLQRIAIYACILGFTLAASGQLWASNLEVHYYLLLLVPIGLAGLLLDESHIWGAAALVIVCSFVVTVQRHGVLDSLPQLFSTTGVCLALAAVIDTKTRALIERLNWAMDIQTKDNRRAESFFDKNEELQDALLQVQFYSSKLEIMNKQLEEAQQRADRASKAKSVFLSNMSHELRTPLNVVIGYSSSMLTMPHMFDNTVLPEIYQPYMRLIEENGQYLVGLINDILDLSKIEAGKVELQCAPTDVTELCRGVMATATGLLKGKPIQIRSEFPATTPLVYADAMRVRQIILNLMSNAVKFTSSGSITLSAAVEDGFVNISVTDTGIGIPPEAQMVIFDRFEQAERDTERKFGGTGLGLDISKQLSLMHGGDLTVRSEVGKGSTFTLKLPVTTEAIVEIPGSKMYLDEGVRIFDEHAPLTGEPSMVVVVEDEASTRQMLRETLESVGHVVVDTNSGTEAIGLIEGLLPSLVILDVFLNDMNGWDVLQQLRNNPETARIPVIMCTADTIQSSEIATGSNFEYLQKPVKPETILRYVEKVLPVQAAVAV